MTWTERHSANAVAAKARRRIERSTAPLTSERPIRLGHLRGRAKWRLQIRDLEHGDSLTLTLHRLPWPASYVDAEGVRHSARSIGKVITTILTQAP